ncbi:unnamed protein product [Clonostachys rosea f. rosea IK726]|jgi:hypothetical protein|uniref:Uncharacterized protein n=1 Tax=Clonostachys rosea f. rosea IK726 TaxID=1349383 RepID=A0ACA9T7L6_BIOOC|nr:unnamed protein product [Clonostachys rosea f. rosea IK726]
MSDPYSEDRVVRFIESLPDETLCPPWADQQVDPNRVQPEEQSEHTSGAQLPEKQRNETETYFDQAVEGRETITTTVSSQSLCLLLKAMGRHEWTAQGIKWEERFIGGENEDQAIWLRVHSNKIRSERCRRLLMFLHKLWFLYQEAPSGHGMYEQTSTVHKAEQAKKFRQLIHAIHSTVGKICAKAHAALSKMPEERGHAANTARSLRCQIIPLLLLVIKAVFMTGSQEETSDSSQALPSEGIFAVFAIQMMRQIMDWVKRLHLAMVNELEVNPPISENVDIETRRRESHKISKVLRQLKLPNRHIMDFTARLTKAYEELEEKANRPKRKREAMEEDKRIRQKREDTKRMEEEAVDRRMALFRSSGQASHARTSTQNSNSQEAEGHGPRHRDADEDHYTQMSTSQGLAKVDPAPIAHRDRRRSQKQNRWAKEERLAGSQPSQSLPQGEASQKVSWSYEESNILLTLIRTTSQPSLADLTEKLPGRNEKEIRQKICELKETSRKFYEERGLIPPKWC